MESRLSDRKLKPMPPDPFRHQNSAIAPLIKPPPISDSVSTSLGAAHASRSARQRPAGFLPGVESASNVACRGKTGVLRRLYRHGRALAEGAVEQEPFAGRFGKPMEHAARADTLLQCRVGHMQRAWDGTVPLAF